MPSDPLQVYYLVMLLNLALRLSWSLRLSAHLYVHATAPALTLLLELLEIFRRFLWNFLRIEWECIKEGHAADLTPSPRQLPGRVRSWDSASSHGHQP